MRYIQFAEPLFKRENGDFIFKVADRIEETKTLIEEGFDICELDETKLFRKSEVTKNVRGGRCGAAGEI